MKTVLGFERDYGQKAKVADRSRTTGLTRSNAPRVYQFKVSLSSRPGIWRIIEIKENQMLSTLHKAIFIAFDRFEEHLYSFFMSNKPYDKASEYTTSYPDVPETVKLANRTRMDSLYLHTGQKFLYLFDYGDEWWHEVELIDVQEAAPQHHYPRIAKKQGKSPPQYSSDE